MQLLGHARVHVGDADAPPSAIPILAYLALGRPHWHIRSVVAANLSPDTDEHRARRRLNTSLWRLRRWLSREAWCPDGLVACRDAVIRFDPAVPLRLDVEQFEATVSTAVNVPDPLTSVVVARLQEGVMLYRGDLLEGCYDEWVLAERARLSDLHLAAVHRLITWHRSRGDMAAVSRFGEEALRRDPFRESVHRELIAAYADAGQRERALDQFERCRRLLATELAVDPMPETLALVGRIRRGSAPPGSSTKQFDLEQIGQELAAIRQEVADLAGMIDRALTALTRQVSSRTASS